MGRLIALLTLFLVGCGGESAQEPKPPVVVAPPPPPEWVQIDVEFQKRTNGYGIIEELGPNSWLFKSHMVDNPECERANIHYCKKVDVWFDYDSSHTPGRETKYSFDLTIERWNFEDPPYHIIIGQDWFKHDPTDPTYSHPFTTWKLKPWRGVSLSQFNNAWQWDYTYLDPYDPEDPPDLLHRHPDDEWNGQAPLTISQTYRIDWVIKDGKTLKDGSVITYIDGLEMSHAHYQTKPIEPVTGSVISFGLYWYRDYNPRVNGCVEATGLPERECKSIQVKIENYTVYERIL